ncbi:MAG: amidohydrolase family protein, partial [Candidatus Lokiarchaeota archaeon]|nr:amidohydrolase family protein [Candidatus Lokiarchaeota archaeon]
MIIDFHIHPFCKEATWGDLEKIADAMWGSDTKKRKRMSVMLKNLSNSYSITNYIELMDQFQIEKAIIVSFNIKTAYGIKLVSNEDISNFVEMYPERFIGFAGIDPPDPQSEEDLEYSITSLDLKGVKLVPPVQKFDITDKKFNSLWKKVNDLNVPLWIHGG